MHAQAKKGGSTWSIGEFICASDAMSMIHFRHAVQTQPRSRRSADCYEEYLDMSDEEYRATLESKRDEITAFTLEQHRTKRSNLYITDDAAEHIAKHFEICRLCDKGRENRIGRRFVSELITQLLQEGRLVAADTTHGVGIRTATAKELRLSSQPAEQVNGQITMTF